MIYFLWALPALTVVAAIASGRLNTTYAAILGLLVAAPVAALTGPVAFGQAQLVQALARGLWIGATIAPYILGGLWWTAELIIGKHRNGPTGTVRLTFIGENTRFENYAAAPGMY